MNGAEFPGTRAELAAVNAQLAGLLATPDRDEARIVTLDLRARALRLRLEKERGVGLGPLGGDGFYGSGF